MLDEWDIPEQPESGESSEEISINDCLEAGPDGVMISNELYHSLPGISGSNLSLLAESNRHLDNKKLFNLGDTPALSFGTLLHTMVLEPYDVESNYAIMPYFDGRTKAGKAEKAEFTEANKNKIIIDAEDHDKATAMTKNVMAICGSVIIAGIKERSLFAEIDNLILKCRLDIEHIDADFDLKSITLGMKEFSDFTLESHIKKLGYHLSAAFRNIIRRHLGKPVGDSFLIFCNTGPGHMVREVQINPFWIEQSEQKVLDMLDNRRLYLSTGVDNPPAIIDDKYREQSY